MKNRKTVLITGASRGIGKAIADKLLTNWNVLTPTRQELDLADTNSIADFFKKNNQPIDALVNNAGINIIKSTSDITVSDLRLINQINLEAPLLLSQYCMKYMKERGEGKIINISSIWGLCSKSHRALYSSTKTGLIGQTRALAKELAPYNILVNSVCPGFTNTELTASSLNNAQLEKLLEQVPLSRLAEPEEIASLVEFLVSPLNTYITGQAIAIDGGFTA